MLNTTGSSLVPLLYYKTAVETVLVTSKYFGVLLHAWILNDSLGFVVLILVHLSNNSEIKKIAIIFVRRLKTMYKETIITYLVWTEWNPTTPIPIGCSCSTRGPLLHFGQSNCPTSRCQLYSLFTPLGFFIPLYFCGVTPLGNYSCLCDIVYYGCSWRGWVVL